MRLLLDSHTLVWAISNSDRLTTRAAAAIEDEANDVLVSVATLWELAIKRVDRRIREKTSDTLQVGNQKLASRPFEGKVRKCVGRLMKWVLSCSIVDPTTWRRCQKRVRVSNSR